ncbi:unnamed protein product [Linum trigynum]|uniref:Uncharacterized protein n=1 Tax=Linum trigynum TaxID=586398 RepID=A0AAV2CKX4_9ROSI
MAAAMAAKLMMFSATVAVFIMAAAAADMPGMPNMPGMPDMPGMGPAPGPSKNSGGFFAPSMAVGVVAAVASFLFARLQV